MKQKPTDYRNRIKALEYVNSADLAAHPGNWREHPAAQAEALKGVLSEVGIAGALLAYRSERQGGALVVIDGHLRKDAAPQAWPVLILDVSDSEADYILSTHDPLAAMATADAGALDALLSSVQSGEAAVQQMLAELAEGAGLYQPQDDPQDADPQVDRAEELRVKWGVESGQLWRLPSRTPGQEHRLICGDCTDAAVVERVMGGERADMVWTDPPYGVDYEGGLNKQKREKLAGDESGAMYGRFLPVAIRYCKENAPMYIWFAATVGKPVFDAVEAVGYKVRAMIVWNKLKAHYGNYMAQYMLKHEPCLYIVSGDASWIGPTNEVTVWDVEQASRNEYHSTEKPLPLALRAIKNHDAPIVADFFVGSGTAIVAAENLSRQCRAVEISPGYVAVALERYATAFGIEPELIT
jgi:DNA modification methylase